MPTLTILPKFAFKSSIKAKVRIVLMKVLSKVDEHYRIATVDFNNLLDCQTPEVKNNFLIFFKTIPNCYIYTNEYITFKRDILKKELGIWPTVKKCSTIDPNLNLEQANIILAEYHRFRRYFYNRKNQQEVFVPEITILSSFINQKVVIKLIKFFEEHKITEYYLYFYCLSEAYQWNRVWSLPSCVSGKALDIWTNNADRIRNDLIKEQMNKENTVKSISIWVDKFDYIEDRKAIYINNKQEDVCFNNPDQTFGYHPKSEICKSCSLKEQCGKRLREAFKKVSNSNLDILKIRGKLISIEEANKELSKHGEFKI